MIVFSLLEARRADQAAVEGAHKMVGIMHKDRERHTATGGWGSEGLSGGDRDNRAVDDNAATMCFDCHHSRQDTDYVFSRRCD